MYNNEARPERIQRRGQGSEGVVFKTILVGDSAVGKSSLMLRYVSDKFSGVHEPTIGTQFATKTIRMDANYKVKLQIWDTAGQQTFRSIIRAFYRNSSAVMLFYKITSLKSFQNLEEWLRDAKENTSQKTIFVLIGTQLDLEAERQVSYDHAVQWMKQKNINIFFQTSAKNDININKAFQQIAKQAFLQQLSARRLTVQQNNLNPQNKNISIISQNQTNKNSQKKCC